MSRRGMDAQLVAAGDGTPRAAFALDEDEAVLLMVSHSETGRRTFSASLNCTPRELLDFAHRIIARANACGFENDQVQDHDPTTCTSTCCNVPAPFQVLR